MKNVHLTMATSGVARLRSRDNQVCGGVNKHRFFVGGRWIFYDLSPLMRRASWMSLGMIVTRLAWIAARLVSSKRPTR